MQTIKVIVILLLGTYNLSHADSVVTNEAAAISNEIQLRHDHFDAPLNDLELNHLSGTPTSLIVTGEDPYLILPDFGTKTDNVGAALFQLTLLSEQLEQANFQLFYETDKHGFKESETVYWRSKINPSNKKVIALIPLDFLSTQPPKQSLLKKLRLDFDGAKDSENWSLDKVQYINRNDLSELQALIPNRLRYVNSQRATGMQLFYNSMKKVTSDIGFTVSYLILLLVTGIGFWRAFKR